MKTTRHHIHILCIAAAAVSAFLVAGCGDTVKVEATAGPRIHDAWLSSDKEGENRVTAYGSNDVIHVKADLADAKKGAVTTAKLIATQVDHPQVPPDTQVASFDQTYDGTLNRMNFDFTNDGPLPSGSYRVELSLDGKPAETLKFTIPK